ncbi:hypothetical protein ACJIZ3_016927 [Penstemon smallii]|uniref:Protein kinase domain-containing protein n=1 Tax=Penstemon smallii TaxID=265156 RepID=A0ABD3SU47_9LAMI
MQLNKSTNHAETMAGEEASGLCSQFAHQDSLGGFPGNDMPVWRNINKNVSVQTGEEFSMKFRQEGAATRVVSAVHGVAPRHERRVGVSDVQDRQMVYEDLARVLGLKRMDSECGSDITEFASARGSTTEIDNGVYVNNECVHHKDIDANGLKPMKYTGEACNDQASLVPTVSLLSECDSSNSLYSSALGISDGSQSGKIKFLCSFGGKILPRPSDGKLRYVGGETRIISIQKNLSWEELVNKTMGICNQPHSIKYQLPGEDLDALISVSSDEDLQNMIDEYYGVEKPEGSQRLRIFLIPLDESETSHTLDDSSIQQSDPDYQYVVALNGLAGAESRSWKYNDGKASSSGAGHFMPYAECSANIDKTLPLAMHPLEMKDGTGVLESTELSRESQKLMKSPSFNQILVQPADLKNVKATMYKSTSSRGSIEGPAVLTTALPLPPEESISYTASQNHNPQFAVNMMCPQHAINKNNVIQPNVMSDLISTGEHVGPQLLEQINSISEGQCHRGVPIMERRYYMDNTLPHPDNLVDILPGSIDSISWYHGMPHASSDSKLQEQGQGQGSAYSSQEVTTQSFSLNLERPQSSSHRVPAALLEKHAQFHDNFGLINSHFQTKVSNADPADPVTGVALLNSPLGLETLRNFEGVHEGINRTVRRDQLSNKDLKNEISVLKTYENEYASRNEAIAKHDANSHPLFSGANFCISNSPAMIPIELSKGLENVTIEPESCVDSPSQESQVYSNLIPQSIIDLTPLIDPKLEQPQKSFFAKSSSGVLKVEQLNSLALVNDSEVARNTHNSQEHSYGENCYTVLPNGGLSNGLVSSEVLLSQPFGHSRDIGYQEHGVMRPEDVNRHMGVDNAGWIKILHNSDLTQNPTGDALYRREVSLLDNDISSYTDHRVEYAVPHEHQKLQDDLLINIKQHQQKPVAVVQNMTFNISAAEFPSIMVPEVASASEMEISSPAVSETANELQNLDSEGDHEDELLSDAIIAEMEADIYGLQIIKNADLEELRELGSGTYGTVYHGKWRGTDVAIKRIKKSCFSGRSSEQERLTKDFWREARILSNLHHPNVVAFYGVVPDGAGGTLATVTEFMANGSLRNVLIKKDKFLDHRKKLIIAMDAAFGMEYLHSKSIVHFDLKCDNLLVSLRDPQRPICKVGDFGLSRIKRNTLVSGGVRGTLPWMAPELLNGSTSRVSEKVDVFSFGIALWEIMTGEEPYANMHCGAIIGGIVKNTLRPPIPERCDPEWRKLMEQCWSADPQARPSFTEITNSLRSMSAALQAKGTTNVVKQLKLNISM